MEDTCTKHTTSSRKAFMHYGCLRQWIWARWQKDWNLYRKHRSFKRIHQHWTFWAELLALCVVFVWSLSFWSTSNPLRGRPCCIAKLFFFFRKGQKYSRFPCFYTERWCRFSQPWIYKGANSNTANRTGSEEGVNKAIRINRLMLSWWRSLSSGRAVSFASDSTLLFVFLACFKF